VSSYCAFSKCSLSGVRLLLFVCIAQAQSYSVLYTFSGNGLNGQPFYPSSGLVINGSGNLFGTTLRGGSAENGAAFELKRSDTGWILQLPHSFQGGTDGIDLYAGLTMGPSGILYGTTTAGGDSSCGISNGCGVVYSLRPGASAPISLEAPWNETVLYRFKAVPTARSPELPSR
jgi:uncharacterized repeat protein (TIGR03803 family)